ncbi:Saccharopine dehydrogenase-domain-containing protein [Cerioporus squamosus]|nr:Saccharopine dehydrogenase-domain-containing protein [Cerioporus squamosus]
MPSDILVLGATGFTGRLITRYLYNHPQRASFTFAIGIRNKAKGEELKKSLGIDDSVKLVQLDVNRYEDVEAAVKDTKVVINVVGPYWLWGTNVVRACAEHGRRYVDLAGEPHFMKKIIEGYDFMSTKTGAIIIPACGFDSVPADLLVFLSNRTLKNALGPDAQLGLSQTFYSLKGGISGGTLATMMSDIENVPRFKLYEAQRDYAIAQARGLPSPPPAAAVRVPFSSQYGAFWPMAIPNRSVVQRTFGVNALTASYAHLLFGVDHAKEKEAELRPLVYGPQFRYAEYMNVGSSKLLAVLFSTLAKLWLLLVFNYAPARWLMKMFMPKPGEGPSDEVMEKGWMNITNYTECASSPGVWAKSVMRGQGDPGYLLTASMISEAALGLALDDASLPASARLGGVLTPSTGLGGVLVSRLEATGRIQFESEIVRANEESKKYR